MMLSSARLIDKLAPSLINCKNADGIRGTSPLIERSSNQKCAALRLDALCLPKKMPGDVELEMFTSFVGKHGNLVVRSGKSSKGLQ